MERKRSRSTLGYRGLAAAAFDHGVRAVERGVAAIRHLDIPDIPPSQELERWLPDARFSDLVTVWTRAPREQLMAALETVTLDEMPLARIVTALRYLPSFGRGEPIAAKRPFLPQLTATRGTILLSRTPDEIVIGTVGRLHHVVEREPVVLQTSEDFAGFTTPGFERLAMSIRVLRKGPRNLLILEHRTRPTDMTVEHQFALYWLLLGPGATFMSRDLLTAVSRRATRESHKPSV